MVKYVFYQKIKLIFDSSKNKINKKVSMSEDKNEAKLGDYKNFMSKEIFEQPNTIKNCLNEYIDKIRNDINLYDFSINLKN